MNKLFEIEIGRPGSFGASTATTLSLPATPYEIMDALDRARVTDERVIYSSEILCCELDYLPQFISPSVNLYELNHLAQRLAGLSEWELNCFEGLVMMDTIRTQYAPIAIDRLINMTHSTADCQIAYEAHDDASLGLFYADNGFVPILETLPEDVFKWLDYSKIGKELREGEGGVFTPSGYVVLNGEIAEEYKSGDAIPKQKPDYTVLLHITKQYFEAPGDDPQLSDTVELPASEIALHMAMKEVDAIIPEECGFTVVDCIIPRLAQTITEDLEASRGGSYAMVNELAVQLQRLNRDGGLPIYKAMLEAAPKDILLEDTLDLAYQTDRFRLLRESASPEDYARAELSNRDIPFKDVLLSSTSLRHYGEKLMERDQSSMTKYGILIARDGQTVEQCLNRSEQSMKLE